MPPMNPNDGFNTLKRMLGSFTTRDQLELAAAARIAELEAIVAKRPKTADGVPVVPGSEVWHPEYMWRPWWVEYCDSSGGYFVPINPDRRGNEWDEAAVSDCYSTPQAAEAAR